MTRVVLEPGTSFVGCLGVRYSLSRILYHDVLLSSSLFLCTLTFVVVTSQTREKFQHFLSRRHAIEPTRLTQLLAPKTSIFSSLTHKTLYTCKDKSKIPLTQIKTIKLLGKLVCNGKEKTSIAPGLT